MRITTRFKVWLTLVMIAGMLSSASAENAATATYQYDELDRLTQVTYEDGTIITYEYDKLGNRLKTTCAGSNCSHTISTLWNTGGSISPVSPTLKNGLSQTFTIAPIIGYHIVDVKADNISQGAMTSYPYTNVTTHHTLEATFSINTYPITVTQSNGGTITPGTTYVNHGSSQTFTINPYNSSYNMDVKVDNVSKGAINSYTFTNATAAHSISATFTCPTQPVRRMPANILYSTVAAAYTAAVDGDTIQMQNITFLEGATITKSITLDGGYDCGFTGKHGFTTLKGSQLQISNGVTKMKDIFVSE